MGIPDYLNLDRAFAEEHDLPVIEYQASFFRTFGRLSIDQEGRLIEHQHRYEWSGEVDDARPGRRVELGDRYLAFHGDTRIYGNAGDLRVDAVLRFTEGIVTAVFHSDAYPEELTLLACAE